MTINSIELFAGAGGLALGFSSQHVEHKAIVEWNSHACNTIRINKQSNVNPIAHWPDVIEGDVRNLDYKEFKEIDLITGGPPCQPFSLGGKHGSFLDQRDMFPQAIRAVRENQPRAFVFENVQGLTRAAFSDYFNYILLQLEYPSVLSTNNEEWLNHLARLIQHQKSGALSEYNIQWKLVNAANYGVPQKRMRVFIVGFRADLKINFKFPPESHSLQSLLLSQWGTGSYWDYHKVAKKDQPVRPLTIDSTLKKNAQMDISGQAAPWLTVRDAIFDLPDPESDSRSAMIQAHKFQPGARIYPGHTGSPLDEPAKALKAGDHGVPGGENMLRRPDGTVRYFTVRESARIQTFPDSFIFSGTWSETMRQLGNAVPVRLASVIAESVCDSLRAARQENLELAA